MARARQTRRSTDERAPTERQPQSLQIHEDIDFQRRDWLAQRIGWGLIALLLAAGLVGLTGYGPLSHVTRSDGRHLTVEYERFMRHGARSTIIFRVAPEAAVAGRARLSIDRRFLAANDLQRLVPEPSATRGRDDEVEFIYDVAAGRGLQVRWTLEPDELGSHSASVRLNDGPAVELAQFTYP